MPAARAAASISPDTRGSRPTMATGRRPWGRVPAVRTWAAAAPSFSARGAVRVLFARPRTPSVPKSRVMPNIMHVHRLLARHHSRYCPNWGRFLGRRWRVVDKQAFEKRTTRPPWEHGEAG